MKYLFRFLLLVTAFAFATAGLILWHERNFAITGLFFFDNDFKPHPVHLVIIGISMIAPALWEIFLLEDKNP